MKEGRHGSNELCKIWSEYKEKEECGIESEQEKRVSER